jgi:hypothetical protein
MRWVLLTIRTCFECLHQMAIVSLQHQTQQHTRFYYHCCHSLGCWWNSSGAATLEGAATRLEWSRNENNGKAGNFYCTIITTTILLYCVGDSVEGQTIL